MKERLLPNQITKVVGVAALMAASTLFLERHNDDQTAIHLFRNNIGIIEHSDSFSVLYRDGNRVDVPGSFSGFGDNTDYFVVGVKKEDQCGVVIFRKNGEIIPLVDEEIRPWRIEYVDDTTIEYYREHDFEIEYRELDRYKNTTKTTGITYYGYYGQPYKEDC